MHDAEFIDRAYTAHRDAGKGDAEAFAAAQADEARAISDDCSARAGCSAIRDGGVLGCRTCSHKGRGLSDPEWKVG